MANHISTLFDTDFESAIARNKRNTIFLFVVLLVIGAAAGYVLGWGVAILQLIWNLPPEEVRRLTAGSVVMDLFAAPRPDAIGGAAILSGAGLIWGIVTLTRGEAILASFAGARPADPTVPLEQRLIDVVAEMAIAAGLPAPQAMIIDTPALNAFATGFSPERSMITATSGLLATCTREELQGVIGHEMGHVADYDIRYTTIVAAMAGVLVLLSHMMGDVARATFGWGPRPGMGYRPRRGGDSDSASGTRFLLTLVVLAILVVVLIVAPLAARLVQMAISRQREFLADATSAKLTRNPTGLIHALERLAASDTEIAGRNSPVSALCIAEPKGRPLEGLLSTHPETADRIMRLRNLGNRPVPGEVVSVPEAGQPPSSFLTGGPWGSVANPAPPSAEPSNGARKGPWG